MEAVVSLVGPRQAFYVADQFLERKVLFSPTIFTENRKNLDFDRISATENTFAPGMKTQHGRCGLVVELRQAFYVADQFLERKVLFFPHNFHQKR